MYAKFKVDRIYQSVKVYWLKKRVQILWWPWQKRKKKKLDMCLWTNTELFRVSNMFYIMCVRWSKCVPSLKSIGFTKVPKRYWLNKHVYKSYGKNYTFNVMPHDTRWCHHHVILILVCNTFWNTRIPSLTPIGPVLPEIEGPKKYTFNVTSHDPRWRHHDDFFSWPSRGWSLRCVLSLKSIKFAKVSKSLV